MEVVWTFWPEGGPIGYFGSVLEPLTKSRYVSSFQEAIALSGTIRAEIPDDRLLHVDLTVPIWKRKGWSFSRGCNSNGERNYLTKRRAKCE